MLIFELRQRTTSTTFIGIMTEHPLDAAIKIIESPMDSELRLAKNYQLVAVKQALFWDVCWFENRALLSQKSMTITPLILGLYSSKLRYSSGTGFSWLTLKPFSKKPTSS